MNIYSDVNYKISIGYVKDFEGQFCLKPNNAGDKKPTKSELGRLDSHRFDY